MEFDCELPFHLLSEYSTRRINVTCTVTTCYTLYLCLELYGFPSTSSFALMKWLMLILLRVFSVGIFTNIVWLQLHVYYKQIFYSLICYKAAIWETSWQNQQNDCAPSEDWDQPGHPPSLIRVFAMRSIGIYGPKLSSGGQRRLWSDWVDAQADLSLRWAHMPFCGFCHEATHLFIIWSYINSR